MKILIIGGHFSPAWATLQLLRRAGARVFYVGRTSSMEGDKNPSLEYQLINKTDIPFFPIVTARLQRHITPMAIFRLLKLPVSFLQAGMVIARIRPNVVVSFGGALAIPVVTCAWLFRIPIVIHEQTAAPGLANRLLAYLSDAVAVSFQETRRMFGRRAVVTGNPVRREVFFTQPKSPEIKHFFARLDRPLIYVTGGGQGAHAINRVVEQVLRQLLERYCILHQTGGSVKTGDFERLTAARGQLPKRLARRLMVVRTIGLSDIGGVLHRARVVVGRSGANTTWEIALLGKAAVLIPLPISASGEQQKQAEWLRRAGLADIIPQTRLHPRALQQAIANRVRAKTHVLSGIDRFAARRLADLVIKVAHA